MTLIRYIPVVLYALECELIDLVIPPVSSSKEISVTRVILDLEISVWRAVIY